MTATVTGERDELPVRARETPEGLDADVVIVGAGLTGLMLAGELCLAGVRPLVLERRAARRETPKANGLGGQILRLLRYRGMLSGFEAASPGPTHPAPIFPFGDVHVDFSGLADPPMWGLSLPQPELERLLEERAVGLGTRVRRGVEVRGASADDAAVRVEVVDGTGSRTVTARYLVGCDGPRSAVRASCGIGFPGSTYPEIHRLGEVSVSDPDARLADGALEVPGFGRLAAGFTRTPRGVLGMGWLRPDTLMVSTIEDAHDGDVETDDESPLTLEEFRRSVRLVLGAEMPIAGASRLSRYRFQARQAERYRVHRTLLAGDAAHQFPATGIGLNVGMLDAVNLAWKLAADLHGWAPPGLLDSYHDERHHAGARGLMQTQAQVALRRGQDAAASALREVFRELLVDEQALRRLGGMLSGSDVVHAPAGAHELVGTFVPDLDLRTAAGRTSVAELMTTARPVLLDLADRPDVREVARPWRDRVRVVSAEADDRPADALLVRPDAHLAGVVPVGGRSDAARRDLRAALSRWFGTPDAAGS